MGGVLSTNERREEVISWARSFLFRNQLEAPDGIQDLKLILGNYFALASIARNKNQSRIQREVAEDLIFDVRVKLEKLAVIFLSDAQLCDEVYKKMVFSGNMFGSSKKQGVSLRLPLASCVPSKLCKSSCYAHDALDATPNSVLRGAINGYIASKFEENKLGNDKLNWIEKQVERAVKKAVHESNEVACQFSRKARIRLAHVGEAAAYPNFINHLSSLIKKLSNSYVDPIVYTRHPNANLLDTNNINMLFSIDASSLDRERFAPQGSIITYADFGDSPPIRAYDVIFKEHHPNEHSVKDAENICPVSIRLNGARSCDAARCNVCFERKK